MWSSRSEVDRMLVRSRTAEGMRRIGVAAEFKADEYRVALAPAGALELARGGHEVWVQEGAGAGAGFSDEDYARMGAHIGDAHAAWSGGVPVRWPV